MVDVKNGHTGHQTPPAPVVPAVLPAGMERRRPGRREHVDPALIPLLRRKPDQEATLPAFELHEDRMADLAPSRGIVIGVLVSIVIWVAGVFGVLYLLN